MEVLNKLEKVIEDRKKSMPEGSYTTYLFTEGVEKICKKVGEESSEVIIAAIKGDKEEVCLEAGDLLYHLLVLLAELDIPLAEVEKVLEERAK